MVTFVKVENKLLLRCPIDDEQENWVVNSLKNEDSVTLKRTFNFKRKHVWKDNERYFDFEPEDILFFFAELHGDYYKIKKGILDIDFDLFYSQRHSC